MGKYAATVQDRLILPARVLQTDGQERLFRLAGRLVPAPVSVSLVIDTGSKRTTLIPGVVRHLQPAPGAEVRVETGLAVVEAALFWIRLEFPGGTLGAIPELAVARLGLPPSFSTLHGVIGRDVLRRWESFLFEGRRGKFTIRDTPGGLRAWFGR